MDAGTRNCKTARNASSWLLALLAAQLCGCLELGVPVGKKPSGGGLAFTSPGSVSVTEPTMSGFYTATTSSNRPVQYSVSGGTDGALFTIGVTSGVLSFNAPPNFEQPADDNGDGTYLVELQAENPSGRTTQQLVRVQVTDVNEAPVFTSGRSAAIDENVLTPYRAAAVDPDLDIVTYGIGGGADAAVFTIDAATGRLAFSAAPDFETPLDQDGDNVYQVDVTADDGRGLVSTISVAVRVNDVYRHRIEIGFPTPGANLGGTDDTTVTGRLRDLEDGSVLLADVAFVDVNGNFALQDLNDASRWTGAAAGDQPDTNLMASVQSANGVTHSVASMHTNQAIIVRPDLMVFGSGPDELLVADGAGIGSLVSMDLGDGTRSLVAEVAPGSGPGILFPQAAIFDAAASRILLLDPAQQVLMSLDLGTGDRTFLSGAGTGAGPAFDFPGALVLHPAGDRVLVVDSNLAAILSVDLATGDRTVLGDAVTGLGIPLIFPTVLTVDATAGVALVADAFHEAIIAVDLTTGDRSVVADFFTGTIINFPIAIELDAAGNRLLLLDFNLQSVVAIDLASGASTELSGPTTGAGPGMTQPRSMAFDASRDRVFVSDIALQQLLAVDLATGDRVPVARSATGTGPSLAAGTALAYSSGDGRLIVAQRQAGAGGLVQVDLDGGDRSALSDAGNGSGPLIDAITGLDLDAANGRVLLTDDTLDALVAVDLSSGDRTLLSGPAAGNGPVFTEPTAVSFEATGNRALVLDDSLDALLAVDPVSGDRTVISSAPVRGAGPALSGPVALSLDTDGGRALVGDADLDALLSIDLATGDRTIVADGSTGGGLPLIDPTAVVYDAANDRAFVASGNNPAVIFAVDMASGDRTLVASPEDHGSPLLLAVTDLIYDPEYDRLFALDSDIEATLVIEAATGQRAITSR